MRRVESLGLRACALALLLSFVEAEVSDCQKTFKSGHSFDLSPLRRSPREKDWYADDRNGNMYYFNVCGDASEVPQACVVMQKAIQAPAYSVSKAGQCNWLGQLQSQEWELIDDSEPAAGVELYYFDGEHCPGGVARDVRIQFFCDPEAGVGKPLDYYVLEEDCHYSITWPSKYGCPVDQNSFLFGLSGWGFVTLFTVCVTLYVAIGMGLNVSTKGIPFGPEALPHLEFWMELPVLCSEGFNFARDKVNEAMGNKKSNYERVDGVEYEWG